MRLYYLSLIFLLFPFKAVAEITFAQLAQISTSPEMLEGHFSQEKYLYELDVKLISTGVFTYNRGKSIHWDTLEPIRNELVMTPVSVTNKQSDGELLRYDMGSNPTAAVLGTIFYSVLTAEWKNLSEYFELDGEIDGQQWHAVLLPMDLVVKRIFNRIDLKGGILLREIILHEIGGDRTTIRLYNQR